MEAWVRCPYTMTRGREGFCLGYCMEAWVRCPYHDQREGGILPGILYGSRGGMRMASILAE